MGKLRKKFNWKGRLQNDAKRPVEEQKTSVVVELQGEDSAALSININVILGFIGTNNIIIMHFYF